MHGTQPYDFSMRDRQQDESNGIDIFLNYHVALVARKQHFGGAHKTAFLRPVFGHLVKCGKMDEKLISFTPRKDNQNMKKLITTMFAASALLAGMAVAQDKPTAPPFAPVTKDIKAATPKSAYVQDARGIIARDPFGLCWRTGYWTPADAVPGCDLPICTPPEELKDGKCVAPPPPPAPAPVAPAPAPAPVVAPVVTAEKVSFAADAFFDFDKATLKPEGKAKLDDVTSKLGTINLEVIIAVGHTDSVGTDAYNDKLSLRRAEAVKAYLLSKGVEANRVYTEGKGEKQPVADNKTANGRAENRRVEIEVVGTKK
jgi:OOP family OmpA-OmpF porin